MKIRQYISFVRLPARKKRWIIGAGVILLVVVSGVIYAASTSYWSTYQKESTDMVTEYRDQLYAALESGQTERLKKLEVVYEAAPLDTACDIPVIMRWQMTVMGALREHEKQCNDRLEKLQRVNTELRVTTDFLKGNQHITELLLATTAVNEFDETKIEEAANAWRQFASEVTKGEMPQSAHQMRSELADRATAIASAWSELQSANIAKDRAKYEASAVEIVKSYDELSATVRTSEDATSDQIKKLETRYNEVFS